MTDIVSLEFALFVAIALLAYYLVGKKIPQWIILLVVNLVFYCYAGPKNIVYILLTAFACWFSARLLGNISAAYKADRKKLTDRNSKAALKAATLKKKRWILWATLVINFGILAYLKYWRLNTTGLLLPLGISFYTFQSVGYLVDVYNDKYRPQENFLKYLLFVSFFPQLIQGPIGRYDALESQLLGEHSPKWERMKHGLLVIAFGLIKKLAVANSLAGPIADALDGTNSLSLSGPTIFTAILMYSAYQYADFSGGIDIVTGVAELFDIDLAPNFRQPYFSTSLGDFWRRWHISLGAWMRDYVFYPLALTKPMQKLGKNVGKKYGKRAGAVMPASIANIIVFFLVGIWHGSELHYVVWGLYNGIVIALSDILSPLFHGGKDVKNTESSKPANLLRILRTFLIVNIGWYFDRIYNVPASFVALGRTFTFRNAGQFAAECAQLWSAELDGKTIALTLAGILVIFVVSVLHEKHRSVLQILSTKPVVVRWAFYYAVLLFVQIVCDYANASSSFMYAFY